MLHSAVVLQQLERLWSRRELIASLTARDLQARYKGSALGVLWSLMHPLALAAVYAVAFRYVIRIPIPHYVLFLLAGLLPWLFFATSLATASLSIVTQGQLVKKVSFPREALPIASVLAQFTHFAIAYLVVIPVASVYDVGAGPALLVLPLLMALLALFTCGLGLVVATAQVYLRDTRHLLDVALQVWFWVTPVVYSMALVPERIRPLFNLNPLVIFIAAFREAVLELRFPEAPHLVALGALSLASFGIGYAIFLRGQRWFAEYV